MPVSGLLYFPLVNAIKWWSDGFYDLYSICKLYWQFTLYMKYLFCSYIYFDNDIILKLDVHVHGLF